MTGRAWSPADVYALGVRTDVETAGSVLGIGRTSAHELARRGEFPVHVIRAGRRYIVPVAGLLQALGLPAPHMQVAGPASPATATTTAAKQMGLQHDDTRKAG